MMYWDEIVYFFELWFVIFVLMDLILVYLDFVYVKRFFLFFYKIWLYQGDVFQFDLNEGEFVFVCCRFDFFGIIINGSKVLFVVMGVMDKDGEFVLVQLLSDKWG